MNPDALLRAGPIGFLQAMPLFPTGYEQVAATGDGFAFFLEQLLASDSELAAGKDAAFRILDLERQPVL